MTFLNPPEIAKSLGVSPERVRGWIAAGQLRASNVGDAGRPRWKISESDFCDFLNNRANIAGSLNKANTRQSRRKTKRAAVKEYF